MGKRRVGGGRPPAQKKPPLTHFLCVPLVTSASRPQLEASLKSFKAQVSPSTAEAQAAAKKAEGGEARNEGVVLPFVHPKSIRPVGTLHCTLGVMSLDKDSLADAISLLQSSEVQSLMQADSTRQNAVSGSGDATGGSSTGTMDAVERPTTPSTADRAGGPLKIDLRGLVSMHPAKNTSILYSAPSDETGRLMPFCTALQKLFRDKGFITEERPLKLHATIVNTIYAKGRNRPARGNTSRSSSEGRSQGHGPHANAPLKIDATTIFGQYEDFVWAKDVVLDRVAICEMGAKKIMDENGEVKDEEYTEVASVPLPR